jgi:uncharacterized protein
MMLKKISKGKLYALDTMVFIYFLERHPSHYTTAKTLFQRIEKGEIRAVISSLIFAELLVPIYRNKDIKQAETIFRLLSNFPNMHIVSVTPQISVRAAQIRSIHGMRTPDAIHAATALEASADAIITRDKEFQKIQEMINVIWFE